MGGGAGGGIGGASRQPAEEPFKPRWVVPDPSVQQARQALREALAEKRAFWQEEMEQCGMGELSESLVELLKRMGIGE